MQKNETVFSFPNLFINLPFLRPSAPPQKKSVKQNEKTEGLERGRKMCHYDKKNLEKLTLYIHFPFLCFFTKQCILVNWSLAIFFPSSKAELLYARNDVNVTKLLQRYGRQQGQWADLEAHGIFRPFPILWKIPSCRDVNAIENRKAFKMW